VGADFKVEVAKGWNPGALSLMVASVAHAVIAMIAIRRSDLQSHFGVLDLVTVLMG
jgi:hypothetical protein